MGAGRIGSRRACREARRANVDAIAIVGAKVYLFSPRRLWKGMKEWRVVMGRKDGKSGLVKVNDD